MASISKSLNHQITKSNTVFLEIAWRWFFLAFAIALLASVVLAVEDVVRLRPNDVAAFRSGNLYWMAATVAGLLRHYRLVLQSSLAVVAVTLGGFWVLVGAALRAVGPASLPAIREAGRDAGPTRRFLGLLALRTASLAAGASALLACLALIVATIRRPWSGPSFSFRAALVMSFCVLVYFCWRWMALLLLTIESAPTLEEGWMTFVSSAPRLALVAATNSTFKWLASLGLTLVLAVLVVAVPIRHRGLGLFVAVVWVLALAGISGYFAARLRKRIWAASDGGAI